MNDIKIIQYLPLTHPRATLKFVKRLDAKGIMTILDLEDSAQDPFDKNKSRDLKINARNNFLKLVNSKEWIGDEFKNPVYVRVNSSSTEFFEDDITIVSKILKSGFPISGIFLPMVESYREIEQTISFLSNHNSDKPLEIIPMIETLKGMEGLQTLLEYDQSKNNFSKVHYGHFDYCLDANLWPFPDPDQSTFWDLVIPMVELILSHNKTYVHTPFPFPNNSNLFWAASRHLIKLFPNKDIWVCTLNSELSISKEDKNRTTLQINDENISMEEMIKEAKLIKKQFLEGRANRRSFGISDHRFIPPHQYFAAEYFLKNFKNK